MKKHAMLFLAAAAFCLAGCSPSSSTSSPKETSSSGTSSSQPTTETSSSSSSNEQLAKVTYSLNAQDYAGALASASSDIYQANSTFAFMPGVKTDTGAKTMTIDGVSTKIAGRIKLSGAIAGTGDNTQKALRIICNKAGGTLRFFAQGGNSSDTTRTWSIYKEDGTCLYTSAKGVSPTVPEEDSYVLPEAGTYYLGSAVNGINIYYVDLTQELALGTETGFSVDANNAIVSYLTGQAFDPTGIIVEKTYSSGAKIALTSKEYTIDSSAFDSAKAGNYAIKIKYGNYAEQAFRVTVHAVKDLKAITTPQMANASSKDVNRFPRVYKVGDTLSSNIVYQAVADDNSIFHLSASSVTIAGDTDFSTAGAKTISFAYSNNGKTYTTSLPVTVIDASTLIADSNGVYSAYVTSAATNGAIVNGVMTFNNVQDATDFLTEVAPNASKKITIASGTYQDKLYIDGNNIALIGESGKAADVVLSDDKDADSIDPNGCSWSTYGSSSTTIASSVIGFSATGITFANYRYKTMVEYNADSGNQQAVAFTNNGVKTIIKNCDFFGFQDTLYNRGTAEYYENCKIQGMTDYVFGEANDVYFKDCSLISWDRGSTSNGGYICAAKPASMDESHIGYVFDNCTISAESTVTANTISLARPWGADAKVSYLNCSMTNVISTSAYPCTDHNARWEEMSGHLPTNAVFQEYGTTGDGAIQEAVAGGSILNESAYQSLVSQIALIYSWLA